MTVQTNGKDTATWHFDSVSEMVRHVDAFDRSDDGRRRKGDSMNHDPERDWDLGIGYTKMKKLALTGGWPEGGARIARGVASLPDTDNAPRRRRRRTYAGARPHVPAYIAGAPKAMVRTVEDENPTKKNKPFVRIVFCLQRAGGVPAHYIENLGVAVVGIADAIESSGRRVEIVARYTYARPAGDFTMMVKAVDDPLNVNALALALCHPGMSRRMLFRLQESPGVDYARTVANNGYCRDNGKWIKEEADSGASIVIPYMMPGSRLSTPESALQWLAEKTKEHTGLDIKVGQ